MYHMIASSLLWVVSITSLNLYPLHPLTSSGTPTALTFSCVGLSKDVSGVVNVTVSWTRSSGDSILISITTNAPQIPYGGILNITTGSVTQRELTGFMAGYEYNITVRGVNCGNLEGSVGEPLTVIPQGIIGR